jgi:hypothetical protein
MKASTPLAGHTHYAPDFAFDATSAYAMEGSTPLAARSWKTFDIQ